MAARIDRHAKPVDGHDTLVSACGWESTSVGGENWSGSAASAGDGEAKKAKAVSKLAAATERAPDPGRLVRCMALIRASGLGDASTPRERARRRYA